MNKRSIAKKFNDAKIGEWSDITTERIKLTAASFTESEESRQEINVQIDKYINTFLTKSVQKKIHGLKVLVNWPTNSSPFNPVVDGVEVFRITKSKYVMLIHVM